MVSKVTILGSEVEQLRIVELTELDKKLQNHDGLHPGAPTHVRLRNTKKFRLLSEALQVFLR